MSRRFPPTTPISSGTARFWLVPLLAICCAAAGAASPQAELEAPQVLERLQRWIDGTTDLQGRFEQLLISGAMGAGLEESGTLFVKRPGQMRWNYLAPEAKVALLREERTWLYLAEDEQLILGTLPEEGELLTLLLAGTGRLAQIFRSSLLATPAIGGSGAYAIVLDPRQQSDSFEQVTLTTRPPEFALEAAEVLDSAGNRVLYRFIDLKRNRGLADDVFRFDPPPGTLVSGAHPD